GQLTWRNRRGHASEGIGKRERGLSGRPNLTASGLPERGNGPALAFGHEPGVDGVAELLVECLVDPADPRAELEEHKSELLIIEVQWRGHHAVGPCAAQPVSWHELGCREN